MNVIDEIKKLEFPSDHYVLVGGSVLAMHGIRKTDDIDILVSPQLFNTCIQRGWQVMPWTKPGKKGKDWLKKGPVELYSEIIMRGENITLNTAIKDIEILNGIPVISLARLLEFKKEYLQLYNRPKDVEDIKRIENYLKHVIA